MKILEQEEFFNVYEKKGLTFQEWLDHFTDNDKLRRTKTIYEETASLVNLITEKLKQLRYKAYIMTIVADWCGDCHNNVPILARIAEQSPNIELKLLIKEKHMNLVLKTNGGEKIPLALIYGQDGYMVDSWVERSTEQYLLVGGLREKYGFESNEKLYEEYRKLFSERKEELRRSTAIEIIDIIHRVEAIQSTSSRINKKQ